MISPIASSSGIARSMSSSLPPAMIVSVPSSAFGADPVTGASTKRVPALGQLAADPARVGGADRRHVDEQRPRARAVHGAVLAEQHLLDLRRRRPPS